MVRRVFPPDATFFRAALCALICLTSLASAQAQEPQPQIQYAFLYSTGVGGFGSLGAPSVGRPGEDDWEGLAFKAGANSSTGFGYNIYAGLAPDRMYKVVSHGERAPTGTGTTFASFGEPVLMYSEAAFFANLKGPNVTAANQRSIWSGWTLRMRARAGAHPPGTPVGVQWANFSALTASRDMLGFTATLRRNVGGITAVNDRGLWLAYGANPPKLAMRTGTPFKSSSGEARGTIRSFTALEPAPLIPEQPFSCGIGDTSVPARLVMTDGSQHLVTCRVAPWGSHGYASSGGQAPGGGRYAAFGIPHFGADNCPAFRADLKVGVEGVVASNRTAIYQGFSGFGSLDGIRVARTGDVARGTNGAKFIAFSDALPASREQTTFLATLGGGDVTTGNATALYRSSNDPETKTATLHLVARTGSEAPGIPASRIARIDAFGIAGANAVYFRATLEVGPGGVTEADNQGVWIETSGRAVIPLIRLGRPFPASRGGNVTSFDLLKPPPPRGNDTPAPAPITLRRSSTVTGTGQTKVVFHAVSSPPSPGQLPFAAIVTAVVP